MTCTNRGVEKEKVEAKNEARKRHRSPAGINQKIGLEPAVLRGDTHRILTSRRTRLRHRR